MTKTELEQLFRDHNLDFVVRASFGGKYIKTSIEAGSHTIISCQLLTARTCCGVQEFGMFRFGDIWVKLPKEIQTNILSWMLHRSTRFQIIYSLENSRDWDCVNNILPELGFTPLKRWKGRMGLMLQAWFK